MAISRDGTSMPSPYGEGWMYRGMDRLAWRFWVRKVFSLPPPAKRVPCPHNCDRNLRT